jgi:hypothetical protein
MFEDNIHYVNGEVKRALKIARLDENYPIQTYRIPLSTETYYSRIFVEGEVDLLAETEVAPLSVTTLEMRLSGKVGKRKIDQRFSFPALGFLY